MRNLVIFLYFVFLFKLTFAQSLSGVPGLGSGTVGQGLATEGTQNIQLAQADILPDNIDLPELSDELEGFDLPDLSQESGIKIGGSNNNTPTVAAATPTNTLSNTIPELPPVIPEGLPEIGLPEIDLPEIDEPSMAVGNSEVAVEQMMNQPIIETKTLQESPIAEPLAIQQEISEIEILKPEDFEDITLDKLEDNTNKSQFPETPELGFNPKKDSEQNKTTGLTAQQKEEQLQDLLNNLLPQNDSTPQNNQPLIVTKGQKKEEQMQELVPEIEISEEKTTQKIISPIARDYENLGKPGRVGYKPVTYSEDQLNEQFVKAAIIGNKRAVIDLLHSGRPANARNKFGETPLMAAIYNGHNDIVEVLLAEGADTNIQDVRGNTPLHVAAAKKNYFSAQQLIRNGAIIDARNRANDTPLLLATLNGFQDIVDLLIREGADVNKANDDGLAPLHVASYAGNTELVKYLLYVGGNANMVTREGYKPYDLAYGRHFPAAQVLAGYTNAQKYVSKELPRIIKNRNSKPESQINLNYSDPYIMFPKAYQQSEVKDRASYEQQQIDWWAAKKRSETSVQNIETSGMSTINTPSAPAQNVSYPKQQQIVAEDTPPVTYNLEYSENTEAPKVFIQGEPKLRNASEPEINNLVSELQSNIEVDPLEVSKGVEFTEAPAPKSLSKEMENIKRPTELVENRITKTNRPVTNQASSLGGNITKATQTKPANAIPKLSKPKSQTLAKVKNLNFQPLNKSVTYDAGSRYASMSKSQQQQWDIRLERWVRSGLRQYNMSEKERVLWQKQEQVLRKVYTNIFDSKVQGMKNSYAKRIKSSRVKSTSYKNRNMSNANYKQVQTPISIRRRINSNRYKKSLNSGYAGRY